MPSSSITAFSARAAALFRYVKLLYGNGGKAGRAAVLSLIRFHVGRFLALTVCVCVCVCVWPLDSCVHSSDGHRSLTAPEALWHLSFCMHLCLSVVYCRPIDVLNPLVHKVAKMVGLT